MLNFITGKECATNRKKFTWYSSFENKKHFYQIVLVNTNTIFPFRVKA